MSDLLRDCDLLRDDVMSTLGPVDDAVVADIIRAGVNIIELQEARIWHLQNKVLVEDGNRPRHPEGPVGEVLDILERVDAVQGVDPYAGATLQPE